MPSRGGGFAGQSLGGAVDAQQRAPLAGQPHDVLAASEAHPEVAVRDPARQRRRLAFQRPDAGLQALQDRLQIVHRRNLPLRGHVGNGTVGAHERPGDSAADPRAAARPGGARRGGHGAAGDHRHAGAPAGQAADGDALPRPRSCSTEPRAATTCSRSTSTWRPSTATRCPRGSGATATCCWCPTWPRCAPCPGRRRRRSAWPTSPGSTAPTCVASPRQILRRQLARLAERGWSANAGTELEFMVFLDTYEEAWQKGYRELRPANLYNVDYSLLGHRPRGAADPAHPQQHGRRRDGRRGLQGRVQLRPARDQLPLRRRAADRRRARDLQERRQGDRRRGGGGDQLHGEVRRARGQLVPHPLLARRRAGPAVRARPSDAVRVVPRRPARRACAR